MDARWFIPLVATVVACDPGPTPEMRARSAAETTRVVRYDNVHDTAATPSTPAEPPPSRKVDKFEKH